MLDFKNVAVGLNILWYPGAEPGWIDEDFIGKISHSGSVKYVGKVSGKDGTWVGVALTQPEGRHTGLYKGTEYFTCSRNCGIFTQPFKLVKVCNVRKSRDGYLPGPKQSNVDELLFTSSGTAPPVSSIPSTAVVTSSYLKNSKTAFQGGYDMDWSEPKHHKPHAISRIVQPKNKRQS